MSSFQQFWWGAFGGIMMIIFNAWFYAHRLPSNAPWPSPNFKFLLICFAWATFPIISGFLSVTCDPGSTILAVYEGASAPAFFIMMAKRLKGDSRCRTASGAITSSNNNNKTNNKRQV